MTIKISGQELVDAVGLLLESKGLINTIKQDVSVKFKALRGAVSASEFWAEIEIVERAEKTAGV